MLAYISVCVCVRACALPSYCPSAAKACCSLTVCKELLMLGGCCFYEPSENMGRVS